MRLPQFRVRTLIALVALSALISLGAVDVCKEFAGPRFIEDTHEGRTVTRLVVQRQTFVRFPVGGWIPLGPCPVAVASWGAALVLGAVWWIRRPRMG